ncbi:2,3-bisphosphoglycerate-independent phosphoglycerate mutase [Candidatus Bathyarchaeota archaeon]|nr:2,3-bisphosphoglycerate-independent phosphoglycerate mutase [Candidatus Bathyarchaeota archaeon]
MKILMVIGDGMADQPLKELNYLTPLEAAKTKNMDKLASVGISGLLYAVGPGIAPGSDLATLAILGYDPYKVYSGRGSFEAAGAGINLKNGDVAFRCNFATVNKDFIVQDPRAGRIRNGVEELEESLKDLHLKSVDDVEVIFKHTLGFKAVLVLRGEGLSEKVAAEMPTVGVKADSIKPLENSREARRTAKVLNEFIRETHRLLRDHPVNRERVKKGLPPANVIVPWGAGRKPHLKPFRELYGLKGACVAAVSLIKGICRLAGMTVLNVEGATGDVDTDTMAKAEAALKALENHDFVFVHVEGPDEASHEGDLEGKISIIRKIDAMLGRLIEETEAEVRIALMADHTTSLRLRRHTADPTPITMVNNEFSKDEVNHFSERAASRGGLGHILGREVMPILLNITEIHERCRF